MRVALLTFARTNNYGATLQCYALAKYIETKGHVVDIINVPLLYPGKERRKNIIQRLQLKCSRLRCKIFKNRELDYEIRYMRTSEEQNRDKEYDLQNMQLFDEFRSKFFPNLTHEYICEKDFDEDYPEADLYIVGSDQVWNLWVTNVQYPLFFFSFVKEGKRRISYAPSFGGDSRFKFTKNEILNIRSFLNNFSGISVRDLTGVNIVNKYFNKDAVQVLDPTFLLNSYDELLNDIDLDAQGCLFNFKFIINDCWVEVIKFIANELKLEIRMDTCLIPIEGLSYKPLCSVQQWLKLIKTSDFIFTDSFHGMVFCILFRKQFIVTPSYKGGEERYIDLAKKLGLEDRVYISPKEIVENRDKWTRSINYDKVYEKVNLWRDISKKYLDKYL